MFYVCGMDKDIKQELSRRKGNRRPSVNYVRNHYVFVSLYDYEVKEVIYSRYGVKPYLFEVLLFSYLCSSLTDQPYFTTTMVYKVMKRKSDRTIRRDLEYLITLGYIDKVKSKGWGVAARYSLNGSALKLLRFYSYTMNRTIQEQDLSYVLE